MPALPEQVLTEARSAADRFVLLRVATAAAIPILALAWAFGPIALVPATAAAAPVVMMALRAARASFRIERVVERLDALHPELEDSTALLLRDPATLHGSLASRQRERIDARLARLRETFPVRALLPGLFPTWAGAAPTLGIALAGAVVVLVLAWPRQLEIVAEVSPPAYTGLETFTSDEGALTIPAGSGVTWRVSGLPRGVDEVEWVAGDEAHALSGSPASVSLDVERDVLYRLRWLDDGRWRESEPRTVSVRLDAPPALLVTSPVLSPVEFRDPPPDGLELTAEIRDDYGPEAAALLLTVAKGQGEGVKFRERRIPISLGAVDGAGQVRAVSTRLDPAALEMEPGDELYVQVEALDGREPEPGRGLSRTIIYRWLAEERGGVTLLGMPVDRMPDYFRSQRQIIIDTERLLADAEAIPEAEFQDRSAQLSADQAALRLRYGQYLGEEAESGGAPVAAAEGEDAGASEDHDDHGHGEEGDHGGEGFGDAGDVIDAFGHSHDYAEQATLFDPGTRGTLKAALAAMWDSELYLGLYEPTTALPFQYEALNNLKAVQQAARIYVKRVGFEPPPLSEERRGTGELDEVGSRGTRARDPLPAGSAQALLAALLDGSATASRPDRLLDELLVDPLTPLQEQAAAARWLDDPQCDACRDELLRSLRDRVPGPPSPVVVPTFGGSESAARAYLDRVEGQP